MQSRTFGLIGYPLLYSYSQEYFSRKFEDEGISNAVYKLFPLQNLGDFREWIGNTPALAGLNVTIPHKIGIIRHLDELDHDARSIGAVNCIRFGKNRLKGFNTDAPAFLKTLKPWLTDTHRQALVLGTGGAARAVRFALNELGIPSRLVSRRPPDSNAVAYEDLAELLPRSTLLVNATPLGMRPLHDKAPNLPYDLIGAKHLCYDLIYEPAVTPFMKLCAIRGARTIGGLAMLTEQADLSWEIWNRPEPHAEPPGTS